jgi:hypothetical protein
MYISNFLVENQNDKKNRSPKENRNSSISETHFNDYSTKKINEFKDNTFSDDPESYDYYEKDYYEEDYLDYQDNHEYEDINYYEEEFSDYQDNFDPNMLEDHPERDFEDEYNSEMIDFDNEEYY